MNELISNLHAIQKAMQVEKSELNKFGGFNYRTAEQILTEAKKHLPSNCAIVCTDSFDVEHKIITAMATFYCNNQNISVQSMAGLTQHKGMSLEQCFGTASSYARKYALCGLLAISDGGLDPDSMESNQASEPAKLGRYENIYRRAIEKLQASPNKEEALKEMKSKLTDLKDIEALQMAYEHIKNK